MKGIGQDPYLPLLKEKANFRQNDYKAKVKAITSKQKLKEAAITRLIDMIIIGYERGTSCQHRYRVQSIWASASVA